MSDQCRKCGARIAEGSVWCDQCVALPENRTRAAPSLGENRETASTSLLADSTRSVNTAGEEVTQRETTLWSGAYSWRALLPAWLAAVLLTVLAGFICLRNTGVKNGLFVTMVVAVISLGGVGLYLAYRRLSVTYELTDESFIVHVGFRTRSSHVFALINVDDVALGQSHVERWLGLGSIKLIVSDSSLSELLLPGIAQVRDVASRIDRARHTARRRRGWFIEVE